MRDGVKRKPWLGGYIRIGPKGPTYVIEKWVGNSHFHISTRCRTERAALKQLERFEAAPRDYKALPDEEPAVTITKELVEEYCEWMLDTKKNTLDWVGNVGRFLAHWRADLGGKDLRELNIQKDIKPALAKRKSQRHRIEALKAFCTWLREEKGLLTTAEDRTLDLPVPPSTAEKTRRRKVVSWEHAQLILKKLEQGRKAHELAHGERPHPRPPSNMNVTRDVLLLQTGTAWHVSEVRRFAESGEIVIPIDGKYEAILVTLHKSGEPTRTPITTKVHLEAAERLRALGSIPTKETIVGHFRWACEAIREDQAKAKPPVPEKDRLPEKIRAGQMRHTVLTWAVELGATPEEAAQFANHRSVETTKKFYLDLAVPTVTVPVRLVKSE